MVARLCCCFTNVLLEMQVYLVAIEILSLLILLLVYRFGFEFSDLSVSFSVYPSTHQIQICLSLAHVMQL